MLRLQPDRGFVKEFHFGLWYTLAVAISVAVVVAVVVVAVAVAVVVAVSVAVVVVFNNSCFCCLFVCF